MNNAHTPDNTLEFSTATAREQLARYTMIHHDRLIAVEQNRLAALKAEVEMDAWTAVIARNTQGGK